MAKGVIKFAQPLGRGDGGGGSGINPQGTEAMREDREACWKEWPEGHRAGTTGEMLIYDAKYC